MKTYNLKVAKNFLPLLENIKGFRQNLAIKVIRVPEDSFNAEIEVQAESDMDFFDLGFFLERERASTQDKHYDLQDMVSLNVEVPGSFVLICKKFDLKPETVLRLFAGDASQHPFITGGSDERMMAADYFKRAYCSSEEDIETAEIFDVLNELRRQWGGNNEMEEFKKLYAKRIEELNL